MEKEKKKKKDTHENSTMTGMVAPAASPIVFCQGGNKRPLDDTKKKSNRAYVGPGDVLLSYCPIAVWSVVDEVRLGFCSRLRDSGGQRTLWR